MKHLLLPVVALAAMAFAMPASATCSGDPHKDQTAEKPMPETDPSPST